METLEFIPIQPADAILCAKDHVGQEPFAVLLGDTHTWWLLEACNAPTDGGLWTISGIGGCFETSTGGKGAV